MQRDKVNAYASWQLKSHEESYPIYGLELCQLYLLGKFRDIACAKLNELIMQITRVFYVCVSRERVEQALEAMVGIKLNIAIVKFVTIQRKVNAITNVLSRKTSSDLICFMRLKIFCNW